MYDVVKEIKKGRDTMKTIIKRSIAEAWRDIPDCLPSQVGETKTSCHRQNDGKVAQGYAL